MLLSSRRVPFPHSFSHCDNARRVQRFFIPYPPSLKKNRPEPGRYLCLYSFSKIHEKNSKLRFILCWHKEDQPRPPWNDLSFDETLAEIDRLLNPKRFPQNFSRRSEILIPLYSFVIQREDIKHVIEEKTLCLYYSSTHPIGHRYELYWDEPDEEVLRGASQLDVFQQLAAFLVE